MTRKYGVVPFFTLPIVYLILGALLLLPIFIGSFAIVIKIIQILFWSPAGGVPVWALFVGGLVFIWGYKKFMGEKTRYGVDDYGQYK